MTHLLTHLITHRSTHRATNVIVNASRIPPRPFGGQRLEAAGQQLEAWKGPPESSWRRLGSYKTSSGELLETSWRPWGCLGEPWGCLGRAGGGIGGVLGGPGAVLEAYMKRLGGSLGRLGAVLGALEATLKPYGHPNRALAATRAENGETTKLVHCISVVNDL